MIKAQDGYHIYGWMKTELNLEGGELLAFSIIFSFVKGFAGKYTGNTSYLSEWMGWSENTSRKYISKLVEKGLIVEQRGRENNHPICHYNLSPDFYEKHHSIIAGSPRKNCGEQPSKIEKSTPQNLRHNIEYNKNIEDKNIEFIPPTPQEVGEYAASLGFRSPEGFGYFYVGHYANTNWMKKNGQPVKNWKNNVREVWMQNNKDKDFSAYIPVNIPVNAKPRNTHFSGL